MHQGSWRLLEAAAASYLDDAQHFGTLIAGKFHRGGNAGGGRTVSSYEHDRSRGTPTAGSSTRARAGEGRIAPRQVISISRSPAPLWATGIKPVPGGFKVSRQSMCWPITTKTTCTAGEANKSAARRSSPTERRFITPFPVVSKPRRTTVSAGGGHLPRPRKPTPASSIPLASISPVSWWTNSVRRQLAGSEPDNRSKNAHGASDPYALASLTDDETVARLATGIKRFTLPAAFNPIKIFQAIADDPKSAEGEQALGGLVSLFENRRQFDRAVQYLERSRALYGDEEGAPKRLHLDQILGAWGQFGAGATQPAGRARRSTFDFVTAARFTLRLTRSWSASSLAM